MSRPFRYGHVAWQMVPRARAVVRYHASRGKLVNALISIALLLSVAAPSPLSTVSVRDFGARGDALHDDTQAFARAIAAVSGSGGVVRVPSVGPGKGYVLTRTLRVPAGVAIVGAEAGFANNAWAAFPVPEKLIVGSKILARPVADQYSGPKKVPLFDLPGGSTVRGLWIFYDRQPWPSDEEFADPKSPFHYASFEEARDRFVREHVKPCGPTFHVTGPNVVIEDIVCDRYYDFFVQSRSAKTFVDRISLYGYRRGFVYLECLDVNRLSRVHLVPSVGPACPGKALPGKTYSWIYGIVVSSPDCVGVQVGRSDGYVFRDLMFFGVHTALRLGASREFPVHDPVTGTDAYEDPPTNVRQGFSMPYVAQGPWGVVTELMADQCAVGIHLVWPTPLTNRMSNVTIHTAFTDGRTFGAAGPSGSTIGRQAAILVEPTHVVANGIGIVPTLMISNLSVGSFSDPDRFARAAADARQCGGRVFMIGGDVAIEVTNAQINSPYTDETTWIASPQAARASLRIRGLVRTGAPMPDLDVRYGYERVGATAEPSVRAFGVATEAPPGGGGGA
ncbi:MAG: hypothetical protein FJX72_08155 [Armatimonadetes bacterium]|nr:hypothetical protein [Armatimonadota bacterium]